MRPGLIDRRISSAIAVRWTPAVAARVARRIEHRLARRRQRRRAALIALALFGLAGAAYAFSRPWARQGRHVATGARRPGHWASPPAAPEQLPAAPEQAPGVPEAASPVPELPSAVGKEAPALGEPSLEERPRPHHVTVARHRTPEETVDALLAAADAARLAGRPADAVAPLTAIFSRHPTDPRAAIAAFQLGRVLTLDLHDPARGAEAFARAHDLDPTGPLASDAAAHAAEARRQTPGQEAK